MVGAVDGVAGPAKQVAGPARLLLALVTADRTLAASEHAATFDSARSSFRCARSSRSLSLALSILRCVPVWRLTPDLDEAASVPSSISASTLQRRVWAAA